MDWDAGSHTNHEEQEEELYCAGPQDPEHIICEGSDEDQTAEEIMTKRRRYEKIGRRYLSGHVPLIQSASLRGPLNRESGWVNPWRSRKAEDWWQPGSEEMLFTRENVMRKAADHGLGYLDPTEALAWCKAAAQSEARKQFDSLNAAYYSGESDLEETHEESPKEDLAQAQTDDGHQVIYDPPTGPSAQKPPVVDTPANITQSYESAYSTMKSLKRPVDTQWLKGSYVSKRARWEDPPQSSPTPLSELPTERHRRRRHGSAKSAGSQSQQHNVTSHPTTPWLHDAQRYGTVSRFSGSTVQAINSKDNGRNTRPKAEDVDKLPEDSRETSFVSAPDFMSASQGKSKSSKPRDLSFHEAEPEDFMVIPHKDTSFETPAERSSTSIQRSASRSNKLPVLPRSPDNHGLVDMDEDVSFVTEVAPSSRNLEKFQFHRKKRRKSHKQKEDEHREGSRDRAAVLYLLEPVLADVLEESNREVSLPIDSLEQLPGSLPADILQDETSCISEPIQELPEVIPAEGFGDEPTLGIDPMDHLLAEPPADDINVDRGKTPPMMQSLRPQSSPEGLSRVEMETASSDNKQFENGYFKKIALMSGNILPNLQFSSPFGLLGSFGGSKPTPTRTPPIEHTHTPRVSDDIDPSDRIEATTVDNIQDLEVTKETNQVTVSDQPELAPADAQSPVKISEEVEDDMTFDRNENISAIASQASPAASNHEQLPVTAPISALKSPRKASSPPYQASAKKDHFDYIDDLSQGIDASTPFDIVPVVSSTSQHAGDSNTSAASIAPLQQSQSPWKSHGTPKSKGRVATLTQASIEDGSTQSFNTTPPKSARKPRTSPKFDPLSHRHISPKAIRDEMDITQVASQNGRGPASSDNSGIDKNWSPQQSISVAVTEPELGKTTPLAPDDGNPTSPFEEQESWEGCGSQSPWAPETVFLKSATRRSPYNDIPLSANHDSFVHIGSSSSDPEENTDSDWQHVERPVTPDTERITPLGPTTSYTPSPQQIEPLSDHEAITDTQELIEAATKNPWASNSKKRGILKKRVSFGDVLSEEKSDSEPDFSRHGLISPPPPQALDRRNVEDTFDDETPVVSKFDKHFSRAARFKRTLGSQSSFLLKSPAVGAMAERFIAADRETSIEGDRQPSLEQSPTPHLQPKSDSRTNSSPETTDYDLEVNLEDVLGDAGEFLNDWSVDLEVKKVKDSRVRKGSRSEASKRREFGFPSVWS